MHWFWQKVQRLDVLITFSHYLYHLMQQLIFLCYLVTRSDGCHTHKPSLVKILQVCILLVCGLCCSIGWVSERNLNNTVQSLVPRRLSCRVEGHKVRLAHCHASSGIVRGSSPKFLASTCQTTIFSTIYISVKRTSFTKSNESVADMTSLYLIYDVTEH